MPTIGQSAMLASVLVGMLSIPAASQSLDVSQPVVENFDNISDSEQNPRTVEESMGPETYARTVKTAFEQFAVEVDGDSSSTTLSTPDTRVEIETRPGEKTFTLETPSGTIVKTYSAEGVKEEITTPEGTLLKERRQGSVNVEFDGNNRQKVEEKAQELRDQLQESMEDLRDRQGLNSSSPSADVSLEVEIQPEGDESISISSDSSIDLEGWNVTDEAENVYTFGDRTLDAGETVTLYSGDGEDNETAVYWGESTIWNNAGDTAHIYNFKGEKVLEKSY